MRYALAPDGYPARIGMPLKGEIFQRYKTTVLDVVVTIDVGFEDAFDVRRDQQFCFTSKCRPMNYCDFVVPYNTTPWRTKRQATRIQI
jgi:hypothetical protein